MLLNNTVRSCSFLVCNVCVVREKRKTSTPKKKHHVMMSDSTFIGKVYYTNNRVHLSIFMLIVSMPLYPCWLWCCVCDNDWRAPMHMIWKSTSESLKQEKRRRKECDDPKRPCRKEAIYAIYLYYYSSSPILEYLIVLLC